MKFLLIFGLAIVLVTSFLVSNVMPSYAQSMKTYHCTASKPCSEICGDHICAPSELAQIKAESAQPTMNNTTGSSTPVTLTPSNGTIVAGKVEYFDQGSDGTIVLARTGHPISGQSLSIILAFKDATDNFIQNQNYAIVVAQNNNTVLSNPTANTSSGTDNLTTNPLSSNDPVNIQVTLNGVGSSTANPSTWTGVKGEVLSFSGVEDVQVPASMSGNETLTANQTMAENMTMTANQAVPEFGSLASIVLAIALLSIVTFAAKTRVISRF